MLEPLVDLLAEVEELVPVETSKLERALEAVRHATPDAEAHERQPHPDREVPPRGQAAQGAEAQRAEAAGDGAERSPPRRPPPVAGGRAAPEPPRILVAKTPGVLAEDHLAEAGRKVLRFHLARMIAREAGHADRQGRGGPARDAGRDAAPAGRVAGVRRGVRRRPDATATGGGSRPSRRTSAPCATWTS